jgi:hypothetical protein
MTVTEEMITQMAQHRKNAFIRAKLSIICLETNADKTKCLSCKSYRICREVLETI